MPLPPPFLHLSLLGQFADLWPWTAQRLQTGGWPRYHKRHKYLSTIRKRVNTPDKATSTSLVDRLDCTIGLECNLRGSVILLERKIENVHARYRGAAAQDTAPQTEKMLSWKRFGRPKLLRRGEGDTDDTALTSRPAKTRRTSVMILCLVLSASLQPTCKLLVFGRRMITKAKKQKGKKRKIEKQKTANRKSKKPWLEECKKKKITLSKKWKYNNRWQKGTNCKKIDN